jgi:DNA helicase-2/ATP-dependent DNA helicase PcrA
MPDNLMENLNKEQLEAVLHKDGPLLIVAGAGTGKTTVITQKIAYMIEQGWAKSDEVLALTFTEKAAGEMEERVDRLLPIGYLDLWISTFHGFAEKILKAHGLDIGLSSDAKLLNEFEQWILIKKNLDKFNLDYYRPAGNQTKFINALLKHFSRLKDEDISPADYLKYAEGLKEDLDNTLSGTKGKARGATKPHPKTSPHPSPCLPDRQASQGEGEFSKEREINEQETMRINEVANAFHVYQQLLLDEGAMDFGDLINYCLKLFRERPAILEKYRQQFKYVLVDEFQDTNWAQYELVKMLVESRSNLIVVGDDDQSIYRFRGASMSNILQFKKDYPKSKQTVLVKNYRSRQNILDLSYDFIKLNNPNRLEFQLNKKTKKQKNKTELNKKLVAQNKGEGKIEMIKGEDLGDEVRQVIERIAELKIKDKEAGWGDFAILVRANDSAKEFCAALDAAGLPYQFLASRGLYSKPVIMDIIAYLKLLDDYHESKAMYRVLNLPPFGFSYQELVNLNFWAGKKTWSLYETMRNASGLSLGAEICGKIDKVLNLISKHTALVRDHGAGEIILAFLNDSGYLKYLISQEEQKSREAANFLNQFMKRVKTFEAGSDDRSIKAFLEEFNMEIDSGEEGGLAPDIEAGPETIKILTVHGAKGLEFKYVFIANLVDKRFPTIERKEQIVIPDELVREILPEGDVHLEEERRLFYVAMTRAKEGLFFSWGKDYGGARKKKLSRFLNEIGVIDINKETKFMKSDFGHPKSDFEEINLKSKILPTGRQVENPKFQIPAFYSYTKLAAFKNCPYQYRFAHVLKIPARGKYIFSFGQSMHLVMQKLFNLINERKAKAQGSLFSKEPRTEKNPRITFEEILDIYNKSWIDDWYENKKQKEEFRDKGKKILKNYYEKFKDNWPNALSLEQGVNLRVGGYRIYGKIDRVDDLGAAGIQIVDYKTGQPKKENDFGLDNKEQLLIYQMALGQIMDKKIANLQFYYLEDGSELDFLGSDKDIEKMEGKIVERIKEIEEATKKDEFPPNPSPLCKYCDFFGICEFRKA